MATTLTFTDSSSQATAINESVSIGAASTDRIVVVSFVGTNNGSPGTFPSTVTLGGNAMTLAQRISSGTDAFGNSCFSAVYWLLVTAGTTATLVISGGSYFDIQAAVYSLTGADTTTPVADTATGAVNTSVQPDFNLNCDVAAGGSLVASTKGYELIGASGSSVTWTGATKDFESFPFTNAHVNSFASASNVSAATPRTITADWSNAVGGGHAATGVAVTFAPGPAPSGASINYTALVSFVSPQSVSTFNGTDIGTAAADRYVGLVVGATVTGTITISSVTIGGNAATAHGFSRDTGSNPASMGLFLINVPSGTTGDIVVTYSGNAFDCFVH